MVGSRSDTIHNILKRNFRYREISSSGHRGTGTGSVSPEALGLCEQLGIRVVAGYCPYMFLPQTPFFHRFHGFLMKVTGAYPEPSH